MLAKRIIPCLDVKDGRVVKGTKFKDLKDAGDAVELARKYEQEGADEIVFLDITASAEKRETVMELVERTAEELFIPFTVGGGIKTLEDVREVLKNGADKVSLNTSAVERPELIREAAREFGSQCIVAAIDAKEKQGPAARKWEVYTYSGKKATGIDVLEWALEAERLGAGEILLTSMDADGTKQGFGLELTRKVSEGVGIPVIASGGAGKKEDFCDVFAMGKADAALAAGIFHYGTLGIREVKAFLREQGVEVR